MVKKGNIGLGPPRVIKVLKQAAAVRVIGDEISWTALGWVWIGRVAGVENTCERLRILKALMDAFELRGSPLTDGAIKDVLRAIEATELLPNGGATRTLPSNGDVFKAEIERLVRSGILLPDQVDPYVRRLGRLDEIAAEAAKAN